MSTYKITVQRLTDTTAEWRQDWLEEARRQNYGARMENAPRTFEDLALSFTADEEAFSALRRACLEAMEPKRDVR